MGHLFRVTASLHADTVKALRRAGSGIGADSHSAVAGKGLEIGPGGIGQQIFVLDHVAAIRDRIK